MRKVLYNLALIALLLVSSLTQAQVIANFNINYSNPNCAPALVTFLNTSTGVPPLTYQWNFGVNPGVSSTIQHPSTTYLVCGIYNVSLTVTNGNGQQSTIVNQVVIHCKPQASFTFPGNIGCAPVGVAFNSNSILGGGAITNYVWDFGDGVGGSGSAPAHTYTNPGCKTVTLVITDINGCVSDTTVINAICPDIPPIADFTSTPSVACAAPISVTYTSVYPGSSGPYTYQWLFQGGTPSISNSQNPSIIYSTPGAYYSQLIVTGPNGCADTIKKYNYVIIGANAANFSIDYLNGCAPLSVYCAVSPNSQALLVQWTAIGGISATPNYSDNLITFNSPGSYQVCVQLTFPGNCIATKCTTVVVGETPLVDFSVSGLQNICAPPLNNVVFTNLSSGTGALTYQWLFPGGTPSSSTSQNPPSVDYTQCGVYSASLIVTSPQGCSDTLTMDSLVQLNCPIANFVASSIKGCIPFDVTFNSSGSFGNPIMWEWNFGDSGNPSSIHSTLQNPSHTFNSSGCFNIRLIITNALGCKDTLKLLNYICAGTQPSVNFSANPLNTCIGVPILFTNLSTGIFPTTNYMWDFNGGPPFTTMSSLYSPTYTYNDTGYFDVALIACNNGCCDTIIFPDYIHINPPLAVINLVKSCVNKFDIVLHGENSIGADTYLWNIVGGTPSTSTLPFVSVHFNTTGTYIATLTVTNNASGCSHTSSQTIQIKNVQADFVITPLTGCAPFNFCINNLSVDASTYAWKIWNIANNVSYFYGTAANPCPTLQIPGVYSAQLIATDVNGCKDTIVKPNYLTVYGSIANFSVNNNTGCAPLFVQFTDLSTSATSVITGWSWDFGDPGSGALNFSALQNPTHIYVNGGMHSVTLAVTDNHGCVNFKTTNSNFITVGHPEIDFEANDSTVCLGTPICFINNTTDVVGSIQYSWNFGDGVGTSGVPVPCYTFTDTGFFDVTLIAQDWWGCTDTLTLPLYIHVTTPNTNFVGDSTFTVCPPLQVNFSNLSTGYDANTQFLWNFGDGSSSTSFNAFHIYTTAGHFDVTLTMTTSNGCVSVVNFPDYINVIGPLANVLVTPLMGCSPLNVCFSSSSLNTINYIWNFGNGTVDLSNTDSICYVYTTPGIFYPAVILNDGIGCIYTLPLDTIIVSQVIAGFTLSANDLCNSGAISFTDTSSSLITVTSWAWNFGDLSSGVLNTSTQQNPTHVFNAPGTYIVTLIAKDAILCESIITDTVIVHQLPDAQFLISANPICPGGIITFTSNSTSTDPLISYLWNFNDVASGALNSASTANASHTFNNAGIYNVILKITTSFGCIDSLVQTITVAAPPIANAGPDQSICLGDSTQIISSGGVTYSWLPSSGLSANNILNPLANPTTTTTYSVLVTGATGCTASDNVVVIVHDLPNINAGNDASICYGTSTQLFATGGSSYNWLPFTALNNVGISNPTASPITTISYVVQGINNWGCIDYDTIVVNVLPTPIADAGIDTVICLFQSATLHASGGISFSWAPANTLDNSFIANPVASPTATLDYIVSVTDTNGCTANDIVNVIVHSLPNINAGNDLFLCVGTPLQLNATGGVSYQWSPAQDLNNSLIANPITSTTVTATYIVNGQDNIGCSNSDSVIVTVIYPLSAQAIDKVDVCDGMQTQLSASGGSVYQWIPSNGLDNPTIPNPTCSVSQNTNYMVIISDGLCFSDTAYVQVLVHALPQAYAGADQVILSGEDAQLTAVGSGTVYSWTPTEGSSCADCISTIVHPGVTTTYTLWIMNEFGCYDSDDVVIKVGCTADVVFVPNAFSPNSDGNNDKLYVRSKGLKSLTYFRIFDRWGSLVFESTELNTGWDGTIRNKIGMPGVYVWYMEGTCPNGQKVELQGNVTMVR